MSLPAVALLSAAAVGYEVLLLRLLAIAYWPHLSAMVISLALLGYGASGTLLHFLGPRLRKRPAEAFAALAALFGFLSAAAFSLSRAIPFDPLEMAWDPRQALRLLGLYLVLALPFLAAASAVGLALTVGDRPHRVYLADLVGAGSGGILVLAGLLLSSPSVCLRLIAFTGFLSAALAAGRVEGRRPLARAVPVAAGLLLAWLWPEAGLRPVMSPYKPLARLLLVPGAAAAAERSGPLGTVAAVISPVVPLRHAPGLSLASPGGPPEQAAVFTDGDAMTAVAAFDGDLGRLAWLDYTPQALPYHLRPRPRVLVLGAGGGAHVLLALFHRAAAVEAVEANPQVAGIVAGDLGRFSGGIYGPRRARLRVEGMRSSVEGRGDRWGLIDLSLLDDSPTAVRSPGEDHLLTVEAFGAMLDRLEGGGAISITGWTSLPPRETPKLVATAATALEKRGWVPPGDRLALVRSWNTFTLLVRREPFTPAEAAAVRAFCRERRFDVSWLPGLGAAEANRFAVLDRDYFHEAAAAILGPDREAFLARYKFFIGPATDDRPNFRHFFRWRSLPEFLRLRTRGGAPLADWGYLAQAATLAQAAAAGLILVILPLIPALRGRARCRPRAGDLPYFACLGLAFILVETAFIRRLDIFLGHPLYAAAAAISSFLLGAGLGSGWGGRRPGRASRRCLAAGALAAGYLLLLPPALSRLAASPPAARWGAAMAFILPLAFLMGMPFPAGLAAVGRRSPASVPWAWGVNGWASVVGAAGGALLLTGFGFSAVLGAGALLYLLAAALARQW